ncbi:unnamed protein product, partial [Musa acuminata subsp. burmannicoides]
LDLGSGESKPDPFKASGAICSLLWSKTPHLSFTTVLFRVHRKPQNHILLGRSFPSLRSCSINRREEPLIRPDRIRTTCVR